MIVRKLKDLQTLRQQYPKTDKEWHHVFATLACHAHIQQHIFDELDVLYNTAKDHSCSKDASTTALTTEDFPQVSKSVMDYTHLRKTWNDIAAQLQNMHVMSLTDLCILLEELTTCYIPRTEPGIEFRKKCKHVYNMQVIVCNALEDLKYKTRIFYPYELSVIDVNDLFAHGTRLAKLDRQPNAERWLPIAQCLTQLVPNNDDAGAYIREIRLLLYASRQKYGDGVYDIKMSQLMFEFGTKAFPPWITRFHGNGFQREIPEGFETLELWYMSECFCYLNASILDDMPELTQSEKAYINVFASVFRYDFCFGFEFHANFTNAKIDPREIEFCANDDCSDYAERTENLCFPCIIKTF